MKLHLTARIKKTAAEDWRKKYDRVEPFNGVGLAEVRLNGKCGFVDKTGKEVVPPKYDYVGDFHGGPAEVELGGKWGFIDEQGKELVSPKYDYVDNFYEIIGADGGFAKVWLDDKVGLIDYDGTEWIKPKYDYLGDFHGGLAAVKLNGKWGFINLRDKVVIPLKYDEYDDVENFSEGFARVRLNGKWISIDQQGNEVDE